MNLLSLLIATIEISLAPVSSEWRTFKAVRLQGASAA